MFINLICNCTCQLIFLLTGNKLKVFNKLLCYLDSDDIVVLLFYTNY